MVNRKEIFLIDGMICVFCVLMIEKVVNKLDYVDSVVVNLVIEKMIVMFDDIILLLNVIEECVFESGYEVLFFKEEIFKS